MNTISKIGSCHGRFSKLPLGDIKAEGWIKQQLEIEAQGVSGHFDELEPNMIAKPYVTREREEQIHVSWSAEISATYWTGLVQLAFVLDDEKLKKKAEAWVNGVLAAQEPDGYMGAYQQTDNRMEDYNACGVGFAVRALIAYYEATGRKDVLDACHRGLLWFVKEWKGHYTDYAGPILIESMAVVFLHTGDKSLLEWAESYMKWLDKNSRWPNSVSAYLRETINHCTIHAVAYGMALPMPAILYSCNGNQEYLQASINATEKVMSLCGQRTGAPSSNNEWLSPPGATCETEYCNFATFAQSFAWLAMIDGDAKYGDWIEKIVFNGAQGAKKKDGRAIAYMSSPNQVLATQNSSIYGPRADMEVYAPIYPVSCCPAQAVRVIPEYVRMFAMSDCDENLYFCCYGPCSMTTRAGGVNVKIEEKTEYPFNDEIEFNLSLERDAKFSLNFKIPTWCKSPSFFVNGQEIKDNFQPGTYFQINRSWKNGDSVRMEFPAEIQIHTVDDRDSANRQPYTIERGPLLFALPINPKWNEVKGSPLTPLPDGWSWYEACPDYHLHDNIHVFHEGCPWNYALDMKDLSPTSEIRFLREDNPTGNPWEKSPVSIEIPAHKIIHGFAHNTQKTYEPYGGWELSDKIESIRLVPYGCTNLRISYFPHS